MDNNIRMFKVSTGEMVLTEVVGVNDEGMYELEYPSVVVPIPPEQGAPPNQIGFGKFMPFSEYGKEILLNPKAVIVDSKPNSQLKETYKNWVSQMKAQESGIIIPRPNAPMPPMPPQGKGMEFDKLNT